MKDMYNFCFNTFLNFFLYKIMYGLFFIYCYTGGSEKFDFFLCFGFLKVI